MRFAGNRFCMWAAATLPLLVACGGDGGVPGVGAGGAGGAVAATGSGGEPSWTEESGRAAQGADGMVVASHPAATRVGADVLIAGGNAVDAAIAMQLALNVVEPMMSGIGGGCFIVVYDAESRQVRVVNARERAPAGASPSMFLDGGNAIPFGQRVTLVQRHRGAGDGQSPRAGARAVGHPAVGHAGRAGH